MMEKIGDWVINPYRHVNILKTVKKAINIRN